MATICKLKNQIDLFNDIIFNKNFKDNDFSAISTYARAIFIFKLVNTIIKEPSINNYHLSSLVNYNLFSKVGSIKETNTLNITDCSMIVLLHNTNKQQLEKDMLTLFELEERDELI